MKRIGRLVTAAICGALAGEVTFRFIALGGSPWLALLPVAMVICMFVYGILSWEWD